MISQSTIDEVLERASLTEVVGSVVPLKRQGSGQVGLCPFHSERSPSFHVRESDGYYHCFGCGESGNVISFVMRTRGISFPDAVEDLASRYGIEVKRDGASKRPAGESDLRQKVFEVNRLALHYFQTSLRSSERVVIDYLLERGLTDEAQEAYAIGFAPNRWSGLVEYLRSQKVADELMLQAGLARRSSRGELYDIFRGRLIFPILIDNRRVAAFGGRIIPAFSEGDSTPKYLNSPESPAYQKQKVLFGVPQAWSAIRESQSVFLVEGYMDVVGLWQAGVKNVVATCGTAATEHHVRRIAHLASRVSVMFDGDEAGQNAAARCFPLFLNSGIDATALFLPVKEDPDSIARTHGEGTQQYLAALPKSSLLDGFVKSLVRRSGVREASELGAALKGKLGAEVATHLRAVHNTIERVEYVQRAALHLGIDARELQQVVDSRGDGVGEAELARSGERDDGASAAAEELVTHGAVGPEDAQSYRAISALPRLDQDILCAVMGKRDELTNDILLDQLLCVVLQRETLLFVQELKEILSESASGEGRRIAVQSLLSRFGPSWKVHWRRSFEMLEDGSVDFLRLFSECRVAAKKVQLNQLVEKTRIERRAATDDAARAELSGREIALMKKLQALN